MIHRAHVTCPARSALSSRRPNIRDNATSRGWERILFKHLVLAGLLAAAATAQAQTYGFDCVTGNAAANCVAGETQIRVVLGSTVATQARFTFTNVGPAALAITDVYFDDGTLLGIAAVSGSSGVSFSPFASPGNLPGGNAIGFQTTAGFSADSDPPVQPNGVNPGESLSILFDLQPGRSFAEIAGDLASGALRIGVHAQGYANGGSESFVNLLSPVPEASSVLSMAAALGVLGLALRRRPRAD